jgi:hypothetical protein
MSYTITQQATTPNAAYTRLLYTVSGSTNTASPQFQYVMDVYESGSSTLIKRTTQTINPAGVATFDPSRIMQGQLSEDNSWKISSVTAFDSSSKVFTLEFGEMYAASISSSAVTIEGIASTNTEVFRGVVEPNAGYFNWDSASYAVLSNMPATMSMQPNDFGTISVYNNNVSYVSQSFYSASLVADTQNYTIVNNFSSLPISSSNTDWEYVDVAVSSSIGLQNYRYEVSNECHREKVRFAFINKLGAWDYYNNYNPVRQAIDVKREQYTAPRVDYSSLTSTYDISRRGLKDYHNSTDDTFTVDTDLLNKTNANWLEELIESPSVYIQRNGEFIPIVITDSSYTANTNQARQKLFQYTINFKPSNQPFGTWIPEYATEEEPASDVLPAFDPLLGGTLQPLMWYDFSDTGSMHITGSDIFGISSKGEYTGSLVRGNTSINNKYASTGSFGVPRWIAPQYTTQTAPDNINKLQYAYFDGSGDYQQYATETHSSLAQLYNSGTLNDYGYEEKGGNGPNNFAFFNTQQNWTHITIFKPNNFSSGSVGIPSDYPGVVGYMQNNTVGTANIDQPSQYNIVNMWNNPTATTSSFYSDNMQWMSSTESFASASYTSFTRQDLCVPVPDTTVSHSNAMYSYEGASGPPGWITAIGRQTRAALPDYPFSQSSTLELMREPAETVLTFTGSGIANEVFCDYYGGGSNNFENLIIGSVSQNNVLFGANFYMAHFLLYSQSLSDTQITNIINSYKSSSFEPVNAITN